MSPQVIDQGAVAGLGPDALAAVVGLVDGEPADLDQRVEHPTGGQVALALVAHTDADAASHGLEPGRLAVQRVDVAAAVDLRPVLAHRAGPGPGQHAPADPLTTEERRVGKE